jgi:hypothetical protein
VDHEAHRMDLSFAAIAQNLRRLASLVGSLTTSFA